MKSILCLVASSVVLAACGGPSAPAKSPDETGSTSTSSAQASVDMPPASSADMPPPPATGETPAPAAAPAKTSAIKVVALTLTVPPKEVKKAGFKSLEIKDDGSILSDGKPVMKIADNELKEFDHGATIFAVAPDGSVTGPTGNAVGKFSSNDELVLAGGGKFAVSDDGILQHTDEKGTASALAPKFDAAPAWAKREAVLVGFALAGFSALGHALQGGAGHPHGAPAKKK